MIPNRYNIANLKRVMNNPSLLGKEFRRIVSRALYPINNIYFNHKYGEGMDVIIQDWDNLIILDACRYDYFEARNDIDGKLRPVLSRGSHSFEFMEGNFIGRELHDTIYITANPHATKLSDDIFYDMRVILDDYLSPEKVVEEALEVYKHNPNKRLIVHLMPPHRPHLGPTADKLREQFNLKDWSTVDKSQNSTTDTTGRPIWNLVIHNEISVDRLRESYRETVDIAIEHAKRLNNELNGKTIITSDHGELLGERAVPLTHRRYGHPHEVDCRTLRIVPWLEIDSQYRREIETEEPIEREKIDDEIVDDRLKALGYKPT